MTQKQARHLMAAVFGVIAYGLIWYVSDWRVALGVFIALWSNNLSINARK